MHMLWACMLLLSLRGNSGNWLKTFCGITDPDSLDGDSSPLAQNLDVYAAALGVQLLLDWLLFALYSSYLTPVVEDSGLPSSPPLRLRLASALLDIAFVQWTLSVGLFVNVVHCLCGWQSNTLGQRMMGIRRVRQVHATERAC